MSSKSLNKRIIGLIIGTTVAGVAKMASTDQGKEKIKTWKEKLIDVTQGTLDFIQGGITELKKHSSPKDSEKTGK